MMPNGPLVDWQLIRRKIKYVEMLYYEIYQRVSVMCARKNPRCEVE